MALITTQTANLTKEKLSEKKNLTQLFIGKPINNVSVSCFAMHGIPIPLYVQNSELFLLFKDQQECGRYADKLRLIRKEMQAYDPESAKPKIQEAVLFIGTVLNGLP